MAIRNVLPVFSLCLVACGSTADGGGATGRPLVTGAPIAQSFAGGGDLDVDRRHVGTIFVIAMENHNFTQPSSQESPQQILGNPAAPYINSLVTPGSANAAQTSYAVSYHNAGQGEHPSEPNYIWAEAGTNFGIHGDADPSAANNNIFDAPHLTRQLDSAHVPWKNYQEDVQLSTAPTVSASGTTGPVNPYNGSTQFNYAVKHNPMAFFSDTGTENVYPLTQFAQDLGSHAVGRYNWITPDQYNDQHSSLNGGFTYKGTAFTGDQASIAQGDNFLSIVVPTIMASDEYKDNGVIVLWWDESEDGDDPSRTLPEIVISPLAKGNAYASSVEMNHSSDLKTMEELFGFSFVNNPIPSSEMNAFGTGFNNVAIVNDLSDLFVAGAIPGPRTFQVASGPVVSVPGSQDAFQLVRVKNTGTSVAPAPVSLVLDNLPAGVTLSNAAGTSAVLAPTGSPYVNLTVPGGFLLPQEETVAFLEFTNSGNAGVSYDTRVLTVTPSP